jgi:fructose-1,6-bisphosphatase/inositol monophosphatase family enzyme
MQLTPKQVNESFAAIQACFRQLRPQFLAGAGKTAHTDKHDGAYVSPVTDIDVEAEKVLLGELAHQFPGMPVYGEESGYADDLTGDFWLIDPLDGTKSFIHNIPAYTSMAVLIQDGVATRCVIYNHHDDEMFTAQKGKGAYKNDTRLDLGSTPLPTSAFCRSRLLEAVNEILKPANVVCEAGPTGAGYGFSMVATGRVAARFNFPHVPGGGYAHDFAPGALLVQEAGGAIVPIDSGTYTYKTRSFVACHPQLKHLVLEHAKQLRDAELQTAKKA